MIKTEERKFPCQTVGAGYCVSYTEFRGRRDVRVSGGWLTVEQRGQRSERGQAGRGRPAVCAPHVARCTSVTSQNKLCNKHVHTTYTNYLTLEYMDTINNAVTGCRITSKQLPASQHKNKVKSWLIQKALCNVEECFLL